MSNIILDAAIELLERDFSVIPVDRMTKKPLISWKEFQSRLPTEEEVESWWTKYPDANVAIITGKISGLTVIDADSQTGIDWVQAHCDKTTVYAKTGKGQHAYYLYPYHTEIKNSVRIAPDVDIRGEGGYVVAPPSTHANGSKYEWIFSGDGFDDMPEFTPVNGFKSLFDNNEKQQTGGNLNVNLSNVKTTPPKSGVEKGSRNNALAQRVGQWAKAGLEIEEIEILAKAWNKQNNPPLGEREMQATIKSIWKIHLQNDPEIIPVPDETPHLQPMTENIDDKPFPVSLLHPGGLLQELMDYIDRNSAASKPMFSLAASLSLVGAVAGQKVMTQTGLRTNLYCISLGYSGSGKNGALSTLPQLLRSTKAMQCQGPTELTSETAILSWIAKDTGRNCWFCLDEIGQVLKGMKNPASPQAGIPRQLTSLFSATDRPISKGYAVSANNIYVPWHHVSMYGTTTPERFWEAISGGEVADGFLARISIFQDLSDPELPRYNTQFDIPDSLVDRINDIWDMPIEWDTSSGNMPDKHVPIPNRIPFTSEAFTIFNSFALHYHTLRNQFKTDELGRASIYGRAAEHAQKIALIHAVSLHGSGITSIDVESVRYSCQLVELLTNNIVSDTTKNITETDVASWKLKILKAIKDIMAKNKAINKDYTGVSIRELQQSRCKGLKSKELQELLNDLVLAESVGKIQITVNGQKAVKYYVV